MTPAYRGVARDDARVPAVVLREDRLLVLGDGLKTVTYVFVRPPCVHGSRIAVNGLEYLAACNCETLRACVKHFGARVALVLA